MLKKSYQERLSIERKKWSSWTGVRGHHKPFWVMNGIIKRRGRELGTLGTSV